MAEFNAAQFKAPAPELPFFTLGVEVGSPAHRLVTGFSTPRLMKGHSHWFLSRGHGEFRGLVVVLVTDDEYTPHTVAICKTKSLEDLEEQMSAGRAYSAVKVPEEYRNRAGQGHFIMECLKEAGLF